MRVRKYAAHSRRTSHRDLCGAFGSCAVDVFRCALGMSCSCEDCAVVLCENVQPCCDVRCMILARLQRDFEVCTQERGSKFSNQFLHGIAFAAEPLSTEVTIKPAGAPGPVSAFVGKRRIVAIRIPEADERRHLDDVVRGAVVCAISAMTDYRTNRGEELLRVLDASHRIKLRISFRIVDSRQTIDLFNIEYGVTLEERDFTLDLVAGLFIGLFASDRISIDHKRSLLSLAYASVKLGRLLEGHPDWSREVLRHGAGPQRQHIDPAVGISVVAEGARDSPSRVFSVPGLEPRSYTAFELAHDLIRDSGIDV